VSHSFDSLEATQRLAVLTGTAAAALSATKTTPLAGTAPGTIEVGPTPAAVVEDRQTATQAIGSIPRPVARTGWRRRDWLLVGGAALAGLLVAGSIVKK
jgi:sensor c-di-GMP phosphodiesterase-like protein